MWRDLNGGYERVPRARVSTEIRTCTPEVTGDQVFVAVIASVWGFVCVEMNEFTLINDVTNDKFGDHLVKNWVFVDVLTFLDQKDKENVQKRVFKEHVSKSNKFEVDIFKVLVFSWYIFKVLLTNNA